MLPHYGVFFLVPQYPSKKPNERGGPFSETSPKVRLGPEPRKVQIAVGVGGPRTGEAEADDAGRLGQHYQHHWGPFLLLGASARHSGGTRHVLSAAPSGS